MAFKKTMESKEAYESYTKDICVKESMPSEEYISYDRYMRVLLMVLLFF